MHYSISVKASCKTHNLGFSLLELMVVIAIIAILAMLAIPSNIGEITQKRIIETLDLVEPYKTNIVNHYKFNSGNFPENNDDAGIPEAHQIMGNYLRKMEVRDGAMHLTLGQKLPEKLHNKIITIRPVFVKDSPNSPVSWICGNNKVPTGMTASGVNLTDVEPLFLPGRCR